MRFRLVVLLILCRCFSVAAQAPVHQRIYLDQLSAMHGLSSYSITDILQDHLGFIWIGTINGVNCFDGYSTLPLHKNADALQPILSNRISHLAEDADHNLWMYDNFHNRLFRLDASRTKVDTVALPHPQVTHLKGDKKQQVWVFTAEEAYCWNKKKGTFQQQGYRKSKSQGGASSQVAWLADELGLPLLLSGLTGNAYPADEHHAYSEARAIIEAAQQEVGKATLRINDVLQANEHSYWLATVSHGIVVAEKKQAGAPWAAANITVRQLRHLPGLDYTLTSDNVTSLCKDDEGGIWIGTFEMGINLYKPGKHNFSRLTHIPHKNYWSEVGTVRAIAEDKAGNTWLGTQEKGVIVLDPQYRFLFSMQDELPSKTIRSIYVDEAGQSAWIGHYEGLSRYDFRTGKVTNGYLEQLREEPYFRVYEIKEDKEKNLWISCWLYLVKYNPRTGASEKIDLTKGLPPLADGLKIRCFDFRGEHELWVGTENYGLLCYDTRTGRSRKITFSGPDFEETAPVTNILRTRFTTEGQLLLSTSRGLLLYNPVTGQTSYPRSKQKINSQRTYAALADSNKGIWVSTVNGLWYYQPQQDSVSTFDYNDGLVSNEFTPNAVLQKQDGSMLFGGNKGIIFFHPEHVVSSPVAPRLLLAGEGWYTQTVVPIVLEAGQKSLRLQTKLISYQAPDKNRIAYRLSGWEENWHYQDGESPVIFYENVPEGTYALEIKGYQEGREEVASVLRIPVTRHPPFWKRSWFLVSLLLLIAAVSWYVHRRRISWIKQEKELQIRHYESELKLLKSQISPHFLFNTLNNIYSLCILEPRKAGEMVMNLSKMLRYMLYECHGDRVSLARELSFLQYYVYMQQEKSGHSHRIDFEVSGQVEQQTIVPLLLINFVENSFKHSDLSLNPQGFIRVQIMVAGAKVLFRTVNTFSGKVQQELLPGGIGIENVRKRLQLFYPQQHELQISKEENQYAVQLTLKTS